MAQVVYSRSACGIHAGRRTILVAMHSFTPVFKGESRQMQVGVLYFRRTRLAEIMLHLLRQEPDLTVGENAPYALTEASDTSWPSSRSTAFRGALA